MDVKRPAGHSRRQLTRTVYFTEGHSWAPPTERTVSIEHILKHYELPLSSP